MPRNLSLLVWLMLAGCTSLSIQPPGTPTPAQIGVFGGAVVATNLSPADYLNYGITEVERSCSSWFGDQVSGARATSTLQQLLALGGTAAGVAGGPIGAGVAAATSMGSAALGAAQSNAPGGAMPAAIYTLVKKQLQAYVAAMPTATTIADAAALIENAAEYCQGPSIAGAIMAALTTVPVATVWAPANFSAVAPSASRVVPPVVVVGTPGTSATPEVAAESVRARAQVSRPRIRRPAAATGDPAHPISLFKLIDDRRTDPELQRKADEEWRTAIGAWLARARAQAEEPVAVSIAPPETHESQEPPPQMVPAVPQRRRF